MAKITLSRDTSGGLAGLAVLIDGEKVGKVRPGNSLTHEVEPGSHEVRIRRLWAHVEANVEVGEDEAVELYCSEADVYSGSADVMAVKTLRALANKGGLRIWIADPPAGE